MEPSWMNEPSSGDTHELRDKAQEQQRTVKDEAVDLRETTRGRLGQEVDRRSTEIGSAAREVATAVRGSSSRLRAEGKELPATVAEKAAQGLERARSYLEGSDPQRIMADVDDVARRMPWVVVGAGVLAGFGLARVPRVGAFVGGAAAGLLAGMLIPTTRVEDERVGPTGERLRERAIETGERAIDRGAELASRAGDRATETMERTGEGVDDAVPPSGASMWSLPAAPDASRGRALGE